MIDLTKPIRHKKYVHEGVEAYRFDQNTDRVLVISSMCKPGTAMILSEQEFNGYYENIPEPRRPRDFIALEDKHGIARESLVTNAPHAISDTIKRDMNCAMLIRLIEWPIDAPLPEWPE